jgi:type IV pilus assembly protein PilP
MYKVLVGLMILSLLAVVGYYRFNEEPLSPRAALDAGLKQVKEKTSLSPEQETLLKVQLAISDYMASHGSAPATLGDLVPKYFDQVPKNPTTGQPFPYRLEGKSPRLGAQVDRSKNVTTTAKQAATGTSSTSEVSGSEGFVNPNTMQADDFTYDKTGKRDPFEPFDFSATPAPTAGGSLTTYTLGELRLTAVVTGPTGEKKGIVEDAAGRGYTVTVGTAIGNEGGHVVSIDNDRLHILVTKTNFAGQEVQTPVEMKINQAGPSGQSKAKKKTK